MRLHLIESSHGSFQAAECAAASLVVHASLIWLAVWMIATGPGLTEGPSAAPLFLAPPDRREAPAAGQTEQFQLGQAGGLFADGPELAGGTGDRLGGRPYGRHRSGERSSTIGLVPFGQTARPTDSVFTMLEVDRMVERYEASAAPIYPPRLSALGREGHVQATFVVDTTGAVDMTSGDRACRGDFSTLTTPGL